MDEEMLTMDGYDDCVVGIVERFGCQPVVCYDKDLIIEKNISMGMSYEEALEFYEFNQVGAWVGEGTPCFLSKIVE